VYESLRSYLREARGEVGHLTTAAIGKTNPFFFMKTVCRIRSDPELFAGSGHGYAIRISAPNLEYNFRRRSEFCYLIPMLFHGKKCSIFSSVNNKKL